MNRAVCEQIERWEQLARVGAKPREHHRTLDAARAGGLPKRLLFGTSADEHQPPVRPSAAGEGKRVNQRTEVLDRIQPADASHDEVRCVEAQRRPGARAILGLDRRTDLDAVVHDRDAGVGKSFGDHVPFEIAGHREDLAPEPLEQRVDAAAFA